MEQLTQLPNIGKVLADKLTRCNIINEDQLRAIGSKNALMQISDCIEGTVCINMLYALEGAIQGIRWHYLSYETKQELKEFYNNTFKGERDEN